MAGIFSGCIRARDNHQARRKRATRGHKLLWVIAAFAEGGMRNCDATVSQRMLALARMHVSHISHVHMYRDEHYEPHLDPH